jgi:putative membrane protein
MMDWDGGWGVVGWIGMGLMMVSIWVIPIAVVVWLVVRGSRNDRVTGTTSPTSHPEEVLADHFARGEIDADEFNRRRELLSSVRSGPP